MILEDFLLQIFGMAVTGSILALLMGRLGMYLFKQQTKIETIKNVLQTMGFKNLKPEDFNKVDEKGLINIIHVIRELKPTAKASGEIAETMALLQSLGQGIGQGIPPPVRKVE